MLEYNAVIGGARTEAQAAVDADPTAAAVRFARLSCRCLCCGRVLSERRSKVLGIGPECRQGVPAELLAELLELVRAAYGEHSLAGAESERAGAS